MENSTFLGKRDDAKPRRTRGGHPQGGPGRRLKKELKRAAFFAEKDFKRAQELERDYDAAASSSSSLRR